MSDRWDFHLRKVDIAWEIAQKRIAWFDIRDRSPQEYEAEVEEALCKAWAAVNTSFPNLED